MTFTPGQQVGLVSQGYGDIGLIGARTIRNVGKLITVKEDPTERYNLDGTKKGDHGYRGAPYLIEYDRYCKLLKAHRAIRDLRNVLANTRLDRVTVGRRGDIERLVLEIPITQEVV